MTGRKRVASIVADATVRVTESPSVDGPEVKVNSLRRSHRLFSVATCFTLASFAFSGLSVLSGIPLLGGAGALLMTISLLTGAAWLDQYAKEAG